MTDLYLDPNEHVDAAGTQREKEGILKGAGSGTVAFDMSKTTGSHLPYLGILGRLACCVDDWWATVEESEESILQDTWCPATTDDDAREDACGDLLCGDG